MALHCVRQRRGNPVITTYPLVSVVIPTYNRAEQLRRVLGALGEQTYPLGRLEVVVVSDGSTDTTDLVLQEDTPFHLVSASQPNQGPAVARNLGIRLASGSLVLFVDDDVVATPRLVEEHVASHAGGAPVAVIGPMLSPPDVRLRPWVEWEQRMLYKQYEALATGRYEASARQFYTGNASVGRHVLTATGGFDPHFRRAEDIELAHRLADAGLSFVFNPDAAAHHYADRSFASWLQIAHDYGVNDVVFARDDRRDDVGRIIRDGFAQRPGMLRSVFEASTRRPWTETVARATWHAAFAAAAAVRADGAAQRALSGLYGTAYYCGVADELGGRTAFREIVVRCERPFVTSSPHLYTSPHPGPDATPPAAGRKRAQP